MTALGWDMTLRPSSFVSNPKAVLKKVKNRSIIYLNGRETCKMRQTTKEALAETLTAMLEKRSIDKITVKDIVATCGVNRQTFYYHFQDIYDLMEWALTRSIEKYADQNLLADMDWREKIKLLFHFFYLHRAAMLHGYDATNRMQYERAAVKWVLPLVQLQLENYPQAACVPEEKKAFICQVYSRTIAGLLLEWIEEGMPDERHVRLEDYFLILDGSIGYALDKFKQ